MKIVTTYYKMTAMMTIIFMMQPLLANNSALYTPFKQELIEKMTKWGSSSIATKKKILGQLKEDQWKNAQNNYEKVGDFDINHISKVIIGSISDRNTHTKSLFYGKSPVACEQVKAAYDNSIYFYERIKNIGNNLLAIYKEMATKSQNDNAQNKAEKKATLLENELQKVAKLLIQTYPPSFSEIDRIQTYEWEFPSLAEAFRSRTIDIEKIEIDSIHIFNQTIDTTKNHKFTSLPFEAPYFQDGKIILNFTLTPAEACLQNLSVELEGNLFLANNAMNQFDWNKQIIIVGGDLPLPSFIPTLPEITNPWIDLPTPTLPGQWDDSNDWCGTGPKPLPLPSPSDNDYTPHPFPSYPSYPFPFPGFEGGLGGGLFSSIIMIPQISQYVPKVSSSSNSRSSRDKHQEWKLFLKAFIDMTAE